MKRMSLLSRVQCYVLFICMSVFVDRWTTCPANQSSSSPTPCFGDRLRCGMTRGSKHRYHRKYYNRMQSSITEGTVEGACWVLILQVIQCQCMWLEGILKERIKQTSICLLLLCVPERCRLCWRTQRWRCAGSSRRPGHGETPMMPATGGRIEAERLPGRATGSPCCLIREQENDGTARWWCTDICLTFGRG